ncbi:GrpB family protein [Algoriphagus aestuariicola]|uniref:GrpB family protein n=1 Tax=Algoriphagus aestuariicola TaxID=1852016 RepID=A0ABS3BM20_9BACT|nr:GrpB family protein [Algoriphagus aestuariicola]MBN7799395.1 GrpB family protein [Algoriphagus aestuariicola]
MDGFIKPHDPEWKNEFKRLREILLAELNCFEIDVQHVGSTTVPNLWAKPILDVDIILFNNELLNDISSILEKLGYEPKGEQGIPGRFAFRQTSNLVPHALGKNTWQEHHLYVCFSDSLALKNHLQFRDVLLQDEKLVGEYSQLKIRLANETGMNREKYWKSKTAFVLSILQNLGFDPRELDEIKKANE